MKSSKLLIVLSVFLVLFSSLLFAGGSNESGKDDVREITLWTCWLDDGDKALFEAFNEAHDDIQVSWELIAFKDYATKIVAAANTNQLPDILRMQPKAPAQYGKAGYLMPVEDIITANGWEGIYPESFLNSNTIDGHLYGIPFYSLPHLLFYRTDMFEANGLKPPTNWDEFELAAKTLSKNGVIGYFTTLNDPSVGHTVHQWMGSNGADTFGPGLKLSINSPETIEVISYLKKLYDEKALNQDIATVSGNDFRMMFQSGKAAMGITSSSFIQVLASESIRENVGVLPIPVNSDNAKNYATFHSYSITTQAKDIEGAKEFLTWINTPENQIIYWEEGTRIGDIPIRSDIKDLYNSIEKLKQYSAFLGPAMETSSKGWTPGMDYGVTEYPGIFDTQNVYQDMVLKTIIDGYTPEEAAAWAEAKMQEIIDNS